MLKSVLKLWPYIRPYKWNLISVLVAGAFVALFAAILPLIIQLLGLVFEQKDIAQTYPRGVAFLAKIFGEEAVQARLSNSLGMVKLLASCIPIYFLIYGFFRFYNYYQSRFLAERVANELRYVIMNRLLSLNANFYMRTKAGSGGLLSRTLNDTMVIQNGMNQYVDLLREPLVALVLIGFMVFLNWKLTVFCIIFAPIIAFVIRRTSTILKRLSGESQETLDVVTKNLKETIDGIRTIQSYGLESHMRERFRQTIDSYNNIRRRVIFGMEIVSPMNEFIVSFLVAGLCIFIGNLIFNGTSTYGEFIAFLAAAGSLDKPIKKIQQAHVVSQMTNVSIDRVFEVIDCEEVVHDTPHPVPFPKDWQTIEFKNIGFKYGTQTILKNISFKVEKGQSVALVGESGSGKSTIVNLLVRFFDPSEGEILIDNININRFALKELRQEMALVTQDVFLFDEAIATNIYAGLPASEAKLTEAIEKANAKKFLDKLPHKFEARAGERGSHFSGGEKQRLSIARAIYKNAPILILDEATSALDSASEAEVQKGLQSLMAGKTSFVVAHRLTTIANADLILVLKSGEIIERGKHTDLLKNDGVYSHYQKLQHMS